MHTPVLLDEVLKGLDIQPGRKYIDATVGEGGHTRKILEKGGEVLAIDWDQDQIAQLQSELADSSIKFAVGNFADIEKIAGENHFGPVDGVLFDFGLSMRQLMDSGKGLSYRKLEESLDMRIQQSEKATAQDILNNYSLDDLYEIFSKYSEEFHSLSIAETIVSTRIKRKINTVNDLIFAIDKALAECKTHKVHGQDVYARIFQALRIAVNDEFTNIEKGIQGSLSILKKGGKIAVITFHSLEDRLIKQIVKNNSSITPVNKHVIRGDYMKSFERSAKLRIIQKI